MVEMNYELSLLFNQKYSTYHTHVEVEITLRTKM